ncbi:MAG TPA: hypothetical protein VLE73_06355 [Candidatus Saccharimonadales bacterium]|nr:hypothetical protein [Candidatus Saccharimonadales bacterium]
MSISQEIGGGIPVTANGTLAPIEAPGAELVALNPTLTAVDGTAQRTASRLGRRRISATPALLSADVIRGRVTAAMTEVAQTFSDTIQDIDIVVPEDTRVRLELHDVDPKDVELPEGWVPRSVKRYKTVDPWHEENPDIVKAVKKLTEDTVAMAEDVRGDIRRMRAVGLSDGRDLAYQDAHRNARGKRTTPITRALMDIDPERYGTMDDPMTMAEWIRRLPNAEGLYPVAHPDGGMYVLVDPKTGVVQHRPSTKALMALTLGSQNGRGVREREVLMEHSTREHLETEAMQKRIHRKGAVWLTDLGSGTGDPGMRIGLSTAPLLGPDGKVIVNAYDNNPNSLAVAKHISAKLADEHPEGKRLRYYGHRSEFATESILRATVRWSRANVYQSAGFTEYTSSEQASTPEERQQRALMGRGGMVSAEDFHAIMYQEMPYGAIWNTGNMQPNEESKFVTDGLGWGYICIRGLYEYASILQRARIPGRAVDLYVPDPANSAAIYNYVGITRTYQ